MTAVLSQLVGRVVVGDQVWSADRLTALREEVVAQLTGRVQPGARVALALEHLGQFAAAYSAVRRVGATAVLMSSRDVASARRDAAMLRAILDDAQCTTVIADDGHVAAIGTGGEGVIVVHDDLPVVQREAAPGERAGSPPGAALIAYTSGSSGLPKGVMIGEDALRFIINTNTRLHGWRADDVFLAALPLSHLAGFSNLATALHQGVSVVASPGFLFAKRVLEVCRTQRATVAGLVPYYLARMLAQPTFDKLTLRLIVLSAAPIVGRDVDQALKRLPGLEVATAYGLTEAFRSLVLPPRDVPAALPALGRTTEGISIELRDDQGVVLPDRTEGTRGIAWIRGPNVMLGYWNRPDETTARVQDGWLNTGDYLIAGPAGTFMFAGRADHMINAGGEKLSCEAVEERVARTRGVVAVAVVGVTDVSSTKVDIVACVVVDDVEVTLEQVRQVCAVDLHSAFLPTRLVTLTSLPRTSTGKIDRSAVVRHVGDLGG